MQPHLDEFHVLAKGVSQEVATFDRYLYFGRSEDLTPISL